MRVKQFRTPLLERTNPYLLTAAAKKYAKGQYMSLYTNRFGQPRSMSRQFRSTYTEALDHAKEVLARWRIEFDRTTKYKTQKENNSHVSNF